jgi:ATP phosphoribosyltransferase regulatory subunit HisZ
MIDYLCEDCRKAFDDVKAGLDAMGIEYTVDPHIVRGLDYYTKTAFEFVSNKIGAQGTVCGGGRYDGLMEELGGPKMPGIGFGMGITRLILAMNHNGGDDLDTGWLRQNDYTGFISFFSPVCITGNCVETLSEEIRLAGGRYETIPIDDVAKMLAGGEDRTLIIANYSAMMMVRSEFVDIGCAEEYWKVTG